MPLSGLSKQTREQMTTYRPVLAIKRYLQGEDLSKLRRGLALSRLTWNQWWQGFQETAVALTENPAELAAVTGFPAHVISGWQEVYRALKTTGTAKERLGKVETRKVSIPPADEEEGFMTG